MKIPPPTSYAKRGGASIAYQAFGDGPAVMVFAHSTVASRFDVGLSVFTSWLSRRWRDDACGTRSRGQGRGLGRAVRASLSADMRVHVAVERAGGRGRRLEGPQNCCGRANLQPVECRRCSSECRIARAAMRPGTSCPGWRAADPSDRTFPSADANAVTNLPNLRHLYLQLPG